jgi:type I restriction enzyme, S subunit
MSNNAVRWLKIGEVCQTTSGGTPSREVSAYYNGEIPWVKSGELSDSFITHTEEKITEAGVKNSSAKIFPAGSLLIALYGATVGRLGILNISAATNQAVCAIFPNNEIYRDYLFYYLLSQRKNLIDSRTGVAQPNISQEILRELFIPLPPLPEQQRIAAILQKADRLRRLRRYARQLSDTYLQSVFLEMFAKYFTDSCTKFGDVFIMPLANGVFEYNGNYGEGTPVIWVDNLYHTVSVETGNLRRAKLDEKNIAKYEVVPGDLLFTRSSLVQEGVGQVNIVPTLSERTTFECHIIRARVNPKEVNPYYIVELYRSTYGRSLIMQKAKTATMTTIAQEDISDLLCPIPPLVEQTLFARTMNRYEKMLANERESERQTEHLFQSLLHRAFEGEL